MKKSLPLIISLLSACSIGGIGADVQAAAPKSAPIIASDSNSATKSVAEQDRNRSDDSQARTTARRRPSGNLRQRPMTPAPTPAPSPQPRFGGGMGRFFGGVAAGALLGSVFSSMLHPFGGFGVGFSLIGLILDAVVLYLAFKLFRRLANRNYGR